MATPSGRRHAHHLLEGATEGGFGSIADLGGNNGPLMMLLLRIWLFGIYLSALESFFLDRADPLWFTFLLAVFGLHYLARFRVKE